MWSPALRLVSRLRANRWLTSVMPATTRATSPEGARSATASTWIQTSVPSGRVALASAPRTDWRLFNATVTGCTDIGPSGASRTNQSASCAYEPTRLSRRIPKSATAASLASST